MPDREMTPGAGFERMVCVVVILLAGLALSSCDQRTDPEASTLTATSPAATPLAAPTCAVAMPEYPVMLPRKAMSSTGEWTYLQSGGLIVAAVPGAGRVCRYRNGAVDRSRFLSTDDLSVLPGQLNSLALGRPGNCPYMSMGLAEDVLLLVRPDRTVDRIFVAHGRCNGVITEGQIRESSEQLLDWLDAVLNDDGLVPVIH